jgi:hypothetical protein
MVSNPFWNATQFALYLYSVANAQSLMLKAWRVDAVMRRYLTAEAATPNRVDQVNLEL